MKYCNLSDLSTPLKQPSEVYVVKKEKKSYFLPQKKAPFSKIQGCSRVGITVITYDDLDLIKKGIFYTSIVVHIHMLLSLC